MKKFYAILLIILVTSLPARAELLDALGEPIPGEGTKGRYTREQVLPFALAFMPGLLLSESSYWENDRFYHEFVIERPDGSIFELEYHSQSGELYEIEVERLSENPELPPDIIDIEEAKTIAYNEIQRRTSGSLPLKIKDARLGIHERKLAYFIDLQKGTKSYSLIIEASSGKKLI